MTQSRASIADHSGPSPDSLDGRVALVTGGSGGIGRALVSRLAAQGAAVAVGYGANAEAAPNTAAEIIPPGGPAVAMGADTLQPASPAQLLDTTLATIRPVILLLVN